MKFKVVGLLFLIFLCSITNKAQSGTPNFPTSSDTQSSLYETANRANSALSSSITSSSTSLTVASAALFPNSGIITIDNENIIYTSKSGNQLLGLIRGQDGSTAASHSAAASVRMLILSTHHQVQSLAIIALQAKIGTGLDTPATGEYFQGTGSGTSGWAVIQASHIPSSIDPLKLSPGTIDSTELGFLNNVSSNIQTQLNAKQTLDGDLSSIAAISASGFSARIGTDTWITRTLTGTANEIDITNTQGIAGSPVFSISNTLDLSGNTSTKPIKVGTTLPATCAVGEYFFDSDAPAGENTYACTGVDVWSLQGDGTAGGGGGGAPTGASYLALTLDATLTAERVFTAGAGISSTDGGPNGTLTVALDLSTLVNNQTVFNGSQASRTVTFNLSGTDPILTLSSSAFNISTGSLQQGGVNVVLQNYTLTGGAGIDTLGDLSAPRTVTWNPTTFVGNIVLWNSANASRTLTAGLSGSNDPVLTFSDNIINVSTGNLQVAGASVATSSNALTVTNKALGSGTSVTSAITWSDAVKQTFNPGTGAAGINFGSHSTNPGGIENADAYYNSSTNNFMGVVNGAWQRFFLSGGMFQMVGGGINTQTVTASSTLYTAPFTGGLHPTESTLSFIMPYDATIRDLRFKTVTTQPASGSLVATVMKNGIATTITATVAANGVASVFSDLSNTESFVTGDTITIRFVNNATVASAQLTMFSLKVIPQ